MLSPQERRSIAALYAFRNYVNKYLSIGEELKVKHNFLEELRKNSDDDVEKMHKVFLEYFRTTDQEYDSVTLELEINSAIEKATSNTCSGAIKGFLDLSKDSNLQILTKLPFLKDNGFKPDLSQTPIEA